MSRKGFFALRAASLTAALFVLSASPPSASARGGSGGYRAAPRRLPAGTAATAAATAAATGGATADFIRASASAWFYPGYYGGTATTITARLRLRADVPLQPAAGRRRFSGRNPGRNGQRAAALRPGRRPRPLAGSGPRGRRGLVRRQPDDAARRATAIRVAGPGPRTRFPVRNPRPLDGGRPRGGPDAHRPASAPTPESAWISAGAETPFRPPLSPSPSDGGSSASWSVARWLLPRRSHRNDREAGHSPESSAAEDADGIAGLGR